MADWQLSDGGYRSDYLCDSLPSQNAKQNRTCKIEMKYLCSSAMYISISILESISLIDLTNHRHRQQNPHPQLSSHSQTRRERCLGGCSPASGGEAGTLFLYHRLILADTLF